MAGRLEGTVTVVHLTRADFGETGRREALAFARAPGVVVVDTFFALREDERRAGLEDAHAWRDGVAGGVIVAAVFSLAARDG